METNDMIPKENKQTAPEASPKHSRQKLKKIITGCIIAAAAIVQLVRTHRAATDAADKDLAICLIGSLAAGFTSLLFFDAFAFPMTMGTLFFVLGLSGAFSRLTLDDTGRPTALSHDVPSTN